MTITNDTIEETLFLNSPISRVWDALTDPAKVAQWFCSKGVEGAFQEGRESTLCFKDARCRLRTERFEPPHVFAWRWVPAEANDNPIEDSGTTLVTFTLKEARGGTEVTMVESGFEALGTETRKAFFFNSEGWDEVLEDFAKFVREPDELPDAMHFRITMNAPIAKVWRALTDPVQAAKAFGSDRIEGSMSEGCSAVAVMGEMRQRMDFLKLEEPNLVVYRWTPGQCFDGELDPSKTTIVEIHLLPYEERTTLILKEYGFAKLGEVGRELFNLNVSGWNGVLLAFKSHMEEHERAEV